VLSVIDFSGIIPKLNESFCFFFQKEARSFLKKRTKKLLLRFARC